MNKEEFIGKLQLCYYGDRNAFNEIVSVYDDLQDKISKSINNIDILQEIIYQQSTNNKEDDFWLLDRLDGIKNTLKGDNNV